MMVKALESRLVEWCREAGVEIDCGTAGMLWRYFCELSRRNKKMNLVSRQPDSVILRKHFVDSVTCVPLLPGRTGLKLIDIGSGAGFPGMVIKIVRNDITVDLLESVRKRCGFLEEIISILGLSGVSAVHGRAEEIAHLDEFRGGYDIVTCRAVSSLVTDLEYGLPFLRVGGLMIVQKGRGAGKELGDADGVMRILGGRLKEVKKLVLPGGREKRTIPVIMKESLTPPVYPRRSGIPARRPLRAENVPRGT